MATLYWTKAQPRAYPRIKYVCMSMDEAARKVIANKGSAGVDGTTVDELLPLLEKYGSSIDQKLENATVRNECWASRRCWIERFSKHW